MELLKSVYILPTIILMRTKIYKHTAQPAQIQNFRQSALIATTHLTLALFGHGTTPALTPMQFFKELACH